ncbi:MAG: hypothetical protein COA78_19720 [Blastopirellula sp.]|nr:MAG: hypothetical protein COA78_19720 [Blastopirellula sp.]
MIYVKSLVLGGLASQFFTEMNMMKRIIIVLMVVLFSGCSTPEPPKTPEEAKQDAITVLKEIGGKVTIIDGNITQVDLRQADDRPDVAVHFKGQFEMQKLILSGVKFTDDDLKNLVGMTKLESLDLSFTRVTDAGLVHLKGLTSLRNLALDYNQISDAGLFHLKALPNLIYINLTRTNITDDGLEHLKALSNLSDLHIKETKITKKGVEKLQAALPKCSITWDE